MHKRLLTICLTGVTSLLCTTAAFADYTVGQHVEFRDDFYAYGGGWIPAVITKDYGPESVERYIVKIDGRPDSNQAARIGLLRPTDGSPRMACRNAADNNYQGPEMEERANRITAERRGAQAPQNAPAPQLAARPAAAPQFNPAAAAAPQFNSAPRAVAPGRNGKLPPNTQQAVLGKGLFPNGQPLGVPGQTNYLNNKRGQKSIIKVADPGQESYIGRWNLKVGGGFTKVYGTEKEVDGRKEWMEEFNFPVDAEVLVISPNGSWFKQSAGGVRTTGSWFDLGQNVVQLVGYDNDDWTGSVIKGQMEIRSPVGEWAYGKRF